MSSPRVPSPDPQALGSSDQRTVLDFHRQDDLNASRQAHHHDLGQGLNQGSPGSHTHDGTDSAELPQTYPWSIRMKSSGGSVPSLGANNYSAWGGTYDSTYGWNSSVADIVGTRIVLPYSGIWLLNQSVTWILSQVGDASSTFMFNDVPIAGDIDSLSMVNISGTHYYRGMLSHQGYHTKGTTTCAAFWQSTGVNVGYNVAITATLLNRID